MKSWLKRVLIAGYCHGVMPISAVTLGFKIFRLEAV